MAEWFTIANSFVIVTQCVSQPFLLQMEQHFRLMQNRSRHMKRGKSVLTELTMKRNEGGTISNILTHHCT